MGVIRVKLANNYVPLPIPAADEYAENNTIVRLIAPDDIIPGTWEIADNVNLQVGYGATAKKASGGYWGFTVCFLFNQATGYTILYQKHLEAQDSAGTIPPDYLKWWNASNQLNLIDWDTDANRGIISETGTFVHPAYLATTRLNEISGQDKMDIDFTYPSPIHQDQPNFYLNDTNINVAIDKRTMQTSQRTEFNVPGLNVLNNEGFGAYGDNPWPKCSMMSFYTATAFAGENKGELIDEMASSILSCASDQSEQWTEQWDIINGEEE